MQNPDGIGNGAQFSPGVYREIPGLFQKSSGIENPLNIKKSAPGKLNSGKISEIGIRLLKTVKIEPVLSFIATKNKELGKTVFLKLTRELVRASCFGTSSERKKIDMNLRKELDQNAFSIIQRKSPKIKELVKNMTHSQKLEMLLSLDKKEFIQDIEFKSFGNRLEGKYFNINEGGKTVLICSGSHGSYEKYIPSIAENYLEQGCNVMLFNYSGFGNSEGEPSEEQVYNDAEAAVNWLKTRKGVEDKNLIVHGYSLGGAAAAHLGTLRPLHIVLDRTFARIGHAAENIASFPVLNQLAAHAIEAHVKFDNAEKMKRQKGSVLLFRAEKDHAMNEKQFGKLKKSLADSTNITFIKGPGGHFDNRPNSLWLSGRNPDSFDSPARRAWQRFISS